MLLYLVRHGETGCNIDKIIQGQSVVSHLNGKGRRQAELARDRIKGCGVDFVYSSPLLRALRACPVSPSCRANSATSSATRFSAIPL